MKLQGICKLAIAALILFVTRSVSKEFLENNLKGYCDSLCLVCQDNICVKCRDGNYLAPGPGYCNPCPYNCNNCTSYSNCTQCKKYYYPSYGYCYSCPKNCDVCDDQGVCNTCLSGFYMKSGVCTVNAATAPLIILASVGVFAVLVYLCIWACKKIGGSVEKPLLMSNYIPAQPAGGFTSA